MSQQQSASGPILTVMEAYQAMYAFFIQLFETFKYDYLVCLLSGLSTMSDGGSADNAYLEEWIECVDKVKDGDVDSRVQMKECLSLDAFNDMGAETLKGQSLLQQQPTNEPVLTLKEAYQTMFAFLVLFNETYSSDDVAVLIGDLSTLNGGQSSNPACLEQWIECVKKAKKGEVDTRMQERE